VRVDIYPDGGMARVRLHGDLGPAGREQLALRWFNLLPDTLARAVLTDRGDGAPAVDDVLARRPLATLADLPAGVRQTIGA
jgi:allantoicase